jgi:hypothetical protein
VYIAWNDGQPCPYCGLSAEAIAQVLHARRRAADAELTEKLEKAIIERDRAQNEARKLAGHLARIKRAVEDPPDDDGGPW